MSVQQLETTSKNDLSLFATAHTPLFSYYTMRPEHARFVKRGANVAAPATAFDVDDTHGWSRATYGDRWVSALVRGVVRRVRGTLVYVHWEDGTDIALHSE